MLTTALAPYLTYIKIAVLAGALALGTVGGCKWKEADMRQEVMEAEKSKQDAVNTYNALIADIASSNKRAQEAKMVAEQNAQQNDKLAKELENKNKELDKTNQAWSKKLKDAKKDPDCEDLLRRNVCAALQDY
ncbi:hypothetical protein [Xanthomonas phage DES1]|nr:hypothetical protein [Xanthomonas phage DES1]